MLEEHALLTEQVRPILLTGLWWEGQDSGWWWVQWMEGYLYSGGYTGCRDTCTVVGTLDGGIHVQWWVHWMEGYMYSGGYSGWRDTCTVVGTLDKQSQVTNTFFGSLPEVVYTVEPLY